MRLIKKEIWKILLRQKVLFWLLVFAVIKILSVNFSNDIRPEYDTKEYRQFLEQYGGQINYKKNESFNECYKELKDKIVEYIHVRDKKMRMGVHPHFIII